MDGTIAITFELPNRGILQNELDVPPLVFTIYAHEHLRRYDLRNFATVVYAYFRLKQFAESPQFIASLTLPANPELSQRLQEIMERERIRQNQNQPMTTNVRLQRLDPETGKPVSKEGYLLSDRFNDIRDTALGIMEATRNDVSHQNTIVILSLVDGLTNLLRSTSSDWIYALNNVRSTARPVATDTRRF